jgi:hypothetical protein
MSSEEFKSISEQKRLLDYYPVTEFRFKITIYLYSYLDIIPRPHSLSSGGTSNFNNAFHKERKYAK